MQYEHDWVMRQIQLLVVAIAKLLFGKNILVEEAESAVDKRMQELVEKLKDEGVCKAEDWLIERIDPEDKLWLETALRFYAAVNELSDSELEDQNFSREEIREGIIHVCKLYGINCPEYIG